ncbi:efflux RND transporter periplasmic adaptor subunit [Oscillibacter valericigenes]|uniref:Efflux RND transporter periplasmic adaptor subunit n=1 Tax=Oscillibacter valericigenes TaxID=351091 RepID=A0ABS2FUQ9_9FIRM|nr:efflux RND transporter periplasmic adaptor subunit [Oscillibacter valericigenes]MBM6850640.1 efflux RND transporter periplasmic adaptor subunit [Oscillibacter valericigenes]
METEWMNETSAEPQSAPAPEKQEKKKFSLKGLGGKKKKRWLKILIVLVVVAAVVVGCVSNMTKNVNNQLSSSYLVATAARQDLTVSVSGTATLQPADSYNVTTLLSGDIVSAPFEEGDLVAKDTLLYTMDSSDAQDSMDRAQISVQQAQLAYQQAQEALHPTATISGTVSEIYVHNGESVNAGAQLAKIVANTELSIDFLFPFAAPSDFYVGQSATVFVDGYAGSQMGTVTYVSNSSTITSNGKQAVSVRVRLNNPGAVSDAVTASAVIGNYSSYGQSPVSMPASTIVYAAGSGTVNDFTKLAGSTVTKGEVLCTVESETIRDQIENARLSLQSAQLSASTAADSVDDYNIKSPISGTVIEKNFKAGDKVDGASSGTLAVIYDLSYLKLEMAVAELDIGKVEVGQRVEITADALEGQTFEGVVDKVSINGTTTNGFTNYPVTIIIEDYGDLKPGMNVSAEIIGEEIPNALCIPVDAVDRGNTVTVPGPGALNEDGTAVVDITKLETKEVTLGRSDDEYIEVTGGLEAGDVVLIRNQASTLMDMMMGG